MMLNFAVHTLKFPFRSGSSAQLFKTQKCPTTVHRRLLLTCQFQPETNRLLEKAAASHSLTKQQVQSLLDLTQTLLNENAKYNLSGIRKPDDIICKHIVDALTLLPTLEAESPDRLIDVGTGAGFPGLVLAIARPDWQVTLLDSARKKTAFHDLVVRDFGLRNVQSVWSRAEDAGQEQVFREQFSVALARSVAELRVLAELTLPFARVGGCVIAQKSLDEDRKEIRAAKRSIEACGGTLELVRSGWPLEWGEVTDIADSNGDRRDKGIVLVRKVSNTPEAYPRKPGVPKKSPL